MAGRRALIAGTAIAASVPFVISGVVAVLATRPKLAARAFGGQASPSRCPSDVGLSADDVEYSPGCDGWWVSATDAVGSVVIVHGFETSDDPRATDPGPRFELAALLVEAGFNCLVVSLGYGTGVHLHSGGALEADDIVAAALWAEAESDVPVAVVGFSAGGHAAVAATYRMRVFGVVTDSSFTDFGEVVIQQGAAVLSVPAWLLAPVPILMKFATRHAPVDLESWPVDRGTPMLHIHGDADQAIPFDNLDRLAAVTGGETLAIGGADHIASLAADPELYSVALLDFLARSLAAFSQPDRSA